MQKKTLIAAGIVSLCVLLAAAYNRLSRPHEGTEDLSPQFSMAAAALYAAYQENEPASDGRFLGKVIQVTGRVSEVSRAGQPAGLVLGDSGSGGINCSFGPAFPDQLKNIHAGDSVSCKGRCTGFLMDVNLADCVLNHFGNK